MKSVWTAAIATALASSAAYSQVPSLALNSIPINFSQEECIRIADRAMRNLGHARIERVGLVGVFADTRDNQSQLVIRCPTFAQIAIFAVAGRNTTGSRSGDLVNEMMDAFKAASNR